MSSSGRQLSAGVMGLKFMQRKREAEIRDQLLAEQEEKRKASQWSVAKMVRDQRLETGGGPVLLGGNVCAFALRCQSSQRSAGSPHS